MGRTSSEHGEGVLSTGECTPKTWIKAMNIGENNINHQLEQRSTLDVRNDQPLGNSQLGIQSDFDWASTLIWKPAANGFQIGIVVAQPWKMPVSLSTSQIWLMIKGPPKLDFGKTSL